jgi:ATP-dependent helicase STH1/SNF2
VTENRPTDPRLSHDSPHLSHGRPIRPFSQSSHTPVSFTSDQINHLRIQIHAFKLLPRDVPIQESIQSMVANPHHTTPGLGRLLPFNATTRTFSGVIKSTDFAGTDFALGIDRVGSARGGNTLKPSLDGLDTSDLPNDHLGDQTDSGIYPYNAYVHRFPLCLQP